MPSQATVKDDPQWDWRIKPGTEPARISVEDKDLFCSPPNDARVQDTLAARHHFC
jgi:hypothetical protein